MQITNLTQFEAFLRARIPTRAALFQGDLGIKRMKYFMRLLGNPQNKLKVIHVAGTSGKGSTSYLMSYMLVSQGFKVGLSISPHVFDIRERMQVFRSADASQTHTTNVGHTNALPSDKLVLKYFQQILPIIKQMENCQYGAPTFFEICVALAYYMFAEEKMDYAVMETGLGGLLDATNCAQVKNKICLITKIGLDHTQILGKTTAKIAAQKAGIIHTKNTVLSIRQSAAATNVIKKTCQEKNAKLEIIRKANYKIISSATDTTVFDFKNDNISLSKIKLGLIGKHQAENCSLALACLSAMSQRDKFRINENLLRDTLRKIKIPGRFEITKINNQTLIIDGAHNPQKMQAFTSNLAALYPRQKFTFIVAFKNGKDYQNMLKQIMPLAEKIYLAGFSISNKDKHLSSVAIEKLRIFLLSQNYSNFEILKANFNLENLFDKEKKPIVITGSLFFIGAISPNIRYLFAFL